ncbi:MAG: prepilin-type N-terminal cleavage/methylation domain-containing protein [Planctomycetes bacterium]|jgi:prepilin-type N-terminal cleavage/methylation domain-containing protein|nr:prepilin-type N-terminal cleavage/methylation domain-containing protein [Planctomycetota bacterium]HPY74139.1 prepilin-type N-terminal cleavage/methylation domain-containing protein [Planctomycetota bacterium]HQA99685.1 prepilin-type N-terminal cleavage/methylation domain-containing protein [Planctomycetota bacterium]
MKKNQNKGFTLLEVMVALSILALATTTLIVVRNNGISQAADSKEQRRLTALLEQKIGELTIGLEKRKGGVFEEPGYENYIWNTTISDEIIESSPDNKGKKYQIFMNKITLIVQHKNNNQIRSQLETYVFVENPEDAKNDHDKDKDKDK